MSNLVRKTLEEGKEGMMDCAREGDTVDCNTRDANVTVHMDGG
jgi:hypothetical protein